MPAPEQPADDAVETTGEADGDVGRSDASGRARPRRRLRDRWVLLTALGLVAVIVVGGAAAVAILGARLSSNVERIADPFEGLTDRPAAATPTPEVGGETRTAMNVLVLGSDSRISAGDPEQWTAGAQRTDAIMLVHLPADGSAAYVMSIPRDSWVDVPGYGEAKINAAYSYGGPTLLIQTVEQLTHVRIDHLAVADFESFTAITDALGGVRLTLAEPLRARRGGEVLVPAGDQVLTGEQALIWARERYSLARGDFDRVQRHQAWLRAILTAVHDRGLLTDPVATVRLLDTVSAAVAVDDGVTLGVMQDMAGRLRGLSARNVSFLTVPVSGTGRSDDGQSIVLLEQPAFDELMAAVAGDTVGAFLAAQPDAVDQLPAVAP